MSKQEGFKLLTKKTKQRQNCDWSRSRAEGLIYISVPQMNCTKLKRKQTRQIRQTAKKKSLRQFQNRCLSDYGIPAQQGEPQQDTTNYLKVIF